MLSFAGQRFGNWTWIYKAKWQRKSEAGNFYWKGKIYSDAVGYGGTQKKMYGDGVQVKIRTGLNLFLCELCPILHFLES